MILIVVVILVFVSEMQAIATVHTAIGYFTIHTVPMSSIISIMLIVGVSSRAVVVLVGQVERDRVA
jgi:hypothetical protein